MPKAKFGKEVGSLKALKRQLKKGGGGSGKRIRFVPKDPGNIVVRFLTEPEDFVLYEECWSDKLRKSFPYSEELEDGVDFDRKSQVFLANALDVESDKVIPFQVKQSVMNSLVIKFEKFGTLMDRDYDIARYGEGLDTEYDVTPEAPKKRNLRKYELLDLHQVLQDEYDAMFGPDDDDDEDGDEDDNRPRPSGGKRRKMHRGGESTTKKTKKRTTSSKPSPKRRVMKKR